MKKTMLLLVIFASLGANPLEDFAKSLIKDRVQTVLEQGFLCLKLKNDGVKRPPECEKLIKNINALMLPIKLKLAASKTRLEEVRKKCQKELNLSPKMSVAQKINKIINLGLNDPKLGLQCLAYAQIRSELLKRPLFDEQI